MFAYSVALILSLITSGAPAPAMTNEIESQPLATAQPVDPAARRSIQSPQIPSGIAETVRVGGALAIVIGLIVLCRMMMKRSGLLSVRAARPSGVLEILAKYPIGRHQQLIVLKFARRIVLAHQSGNAMTTLSEMTDQDEVAALLGKLEAGSNDDTADSFRSMFREFTHDSTKSIAGNEPWSVSDTEIVDLTRGSRMRKINRFFGRSMA